MVETNSIIPVAVFGFNRPDKLERVLNALRTQSVDRLIIFVDGPRDQADVALVEQCQYLAKNVGWTNTDLYFKKINHGLAGLKDNINTVLELHRWAVFVEDDCLPMPDFYSFMCQALEHYKDEKKVFSIGGYQVIPEKFFKNYPYSVVSSPRFWCWGWATWQDRWKSVIQYFPRYQKLFDDWTLVPNIAGSDFPKIIRDHPEGVIDFDIKVAITTLWLGRVHLLPTRGLVRNIGLGGGSHGNRTNEYDPSHNRNVNTKKLPERLVWLENLLPESYYIEKIKKHVEPTPYPSISYRIRRKLGRLLASIPINRS